MKARQKLLFPVRRKARRRRKPRGERRRVPHRVREAVAASHPVHVTIRLAEGLPSLRSRKSFGVVRKCFRLAKERLGVRLVHFSVMGNHMHLIVEAAHRKALARAMQGLKIRVAKQLNRVWERAGTVFSERYHTHVLKTPTEVRNALCYVLNNARHHKLKLVGELDPCASGPWFHGWKGRRKPLVEIATDSPVTAPRTWLISAGFRRSRVPIPLNEVPPPESL